MCFFVHILGVGVGWVADSLQHGLAKWNRRRLRTASIITLFILGTPLKSTHLQKRSLSIQNSFGLWNSGPWDPWQALDENKKFLVPQQGL